jgi:hypothetical protein
MNIWNGGKQVETFSSKLVVKRPQPLEKQNKEQDEFKKSLGD